MAGVWHIVYCNIYSLTQPRDHPRARRGAAAGERTRKAACMAAWHGGRLSGGIRGYSMEAQVQAQVQVQGTGYRDRAGAGIPVGTTGRETLTQLYMYTHRIANILHLAKRSALNETHGPEWPLHCTAQNAPRLGTTHDYASSGNNQSGPLPVTPSHSAGVHTSCCFPCSLVSSLFCPYNHDDGRCFGW